MKIYEITEDKGSTLASRTISRYADEIGPDSMDYDMFKKTAELLDAGKLKSLAQQDGDGLCLFQGSCVFSRKWVYSFF